VHPARSHESPFTTSPKIPVHLERHFHSNLSLRVSIHLHISRRSSSSRHCTSASTAPNERLSSLHHHVLISIRTIILSTHRSSRSGCRLAHPGDPENHIPMIHLPLTRNSLHLPSGFSIFIFIASTVSLFDSQGDARHTTFFVSFLEGARSPSRARGLALQDLGLKVYRYFCSPR
jgi:hypothetical protein